MKELSIEKMIETACKTRQPVTSSCMLGEPALHGESPVIDITPTGATSLPQPSSPLRWQREAPWARPRTSLVPRLSYNQASYQANAGHDFPVISPKVKRMLAGIDGSNLPTVLTSDSNAEVFSSLVEWEFAGLTADRRERLLKALGIDVGRHWRPGRRRNSDNDKGNESILSLASSGLNRGPLEAAQVVGGLLGLKPEYCFHTFPAGSNTPPPLPPGTSIIEEYIPKQLIVRGRSYQLEDVDYLHDFSGFKEQAVCRYTSGNGDFFVLASRVEKDGEPALRIGSAPASAWLYSRTRMARYRKAPVLLCLGTRVAMHFREKAREGRLLERAGIIASGCFGGGTAFDALHFKDLAGHPVVIIPDSTREGVKGAEDWAKRCVREGAANVSVYPWPIIVPGVPVLDDSCPQEPWEKELWGRAVYLDRIELPSKLAQDVCRLSITTADYRGWLASVGLVSVPTEEVRESKGTIPFLRLGDIQGEEPGGTHVLTLDILITSRYTTLIWGCSNAGKSWVAIQLALAMAGGFNAFGLPAMAPRRVCYLDGEVGKEDFKARCDQLLQDNPDAQVLVNQNLSIVPQSGLNILDAACSQKVIEQLRHVKADVLVIDNLLSLAPSAAKSNADGLFNFVRQVEQAGIAVIIVHHSGKDGTNFKGSADLASLSQNVIRLDGREQLASQENRSPELEEVCQADGPVVRMTVSKCKAAPQLERKSCTYHLPVGGGWRNIEGFLADVEQSPMSEGLSSEPRAMEPPVIPAWDVDMDSLSPDEDKVFNVLKKQKSIRVELETRTGLKADKLGGILRKLKGRGLIVKEGNGKATYYRCV